VILFIKNYLNLKFELKKSGGIYLDK
jgi:hypothetical protein